MKRARIRGTALAETALVAGVGFAILWGAIEVGVAGYSQLLADGGAFLLAHRAALGDTNAAQTAQTAFAGLGGGGTTSTQALAASDTVVPVDFGMDANARHGGVSLVRGTHLQATVDRTPIEGIILAPGTAPIHITGAFIEPKTQTYDFGFNLPTAGYNSSASFDTARDYFSDDQDVPPYDIGFRFMTWCTGTWGTTCSNATFLSLDSAETLDQNNWTLPVGAGTGQMFQEMGFHQRVFASLSQQIPATAPSAAPGAIPAQWDESNATSLICTPYSWDRTLTGGYTLGVQTVGAYPWNGMHQC